MTDTSWVLPEETMVVTTEEGKEVEAVLAEQAEDGVAVVEAILEHEPEPTPVESPQEGPLPGSSSPPQEEAKTEPSSAEEDPPDPSPVKEDLGSEEPPVEEIAEPLPTKPVEELVEPPQEELVEEAKEEPEMELIPITEPTKEVSDDSIPESPVEEIVELPLPDTVEPIGEPPQEEPVSKAIVEEVPQEPEPILEEVPKESELVVEETAIPEPAIEETVEVPPILEMIQATQVPEAMFVHPDTPATPLALTLPRVPSLPVFGKLKVKKRDKIRGRIPKAPLTLLVGREIAGSTSIR